MTAGRKLRRNGYGHRLDRILEEAPRLPLRTDESSSVRVGNIHSAGEEPWSDENPMIRSGAWGETRFVTAEWARFLMLSGALPELLELLSESIESEDYAVREKALAAKNKLVEIMEHIDADLPF